MEPLANNIKTFSLTMLFTSFYFALFFALVWIMVWFPLKNRHQAQNGFLLLAGYLFYGSWNMTFVALLVGVTLANYLIGKRLFFLPPSPGRKGWLVAGLTLNIGILVVFKYLDFFAEPVIQLLHSIGFSVQPLLLRLLLPVGISFYLFLAISYLMDVYQHKLTSPPPLIPFALSIGFFPILLAGPVHRPAWLLPQILTPRRFNGELAVSGLRRILWGLVMKLVIADHCAIHVDTIFQQAGWLSSSTLLLGILLFAIQIYADFAGYSHMAIGLANLLGFTIIQNFSYPYFSRDIRQFWQRWNISLTLWFRDYLFLPVAYAFSRKWKQQRILGMRTETLIYIIAMTLTWSLTGLWHGASLTFVIWGMLHGTYLTLYQVTRKQRKRFYRFSENRRFSFLVVLFEGFLTLLLVLAAWLFFRAPSLSQAWNYAGNLFSESLLSIPHFPGDSHLVTLLLLIIGFFTVEWLGRKEISPLEGLIFRFSFPRWSRWLIYSALVLLVIFYTVPAQPFIYFNF